MGSKVAAGGGGKRCSTLTYRAARSCGLDARQAAVAVVCRALDDRDRRQTGLPSESELIDLAKNQKVKAAGSKGQMDVQKDKTELTMARAVTLTL